MANLKLGVPSRECKSGEPDGINIQCVHYSDINVRAYIMRVVVVALVLLLLLLLLLQYYYYSYYYYDCYYLYYK